MSASVLHSFVLGTTLTLAPLAAFAAHAAPPTSTSPSTPDDEAAHRAAIELVLTEMSRAVLASDKDAYLRHVSKADPHFATEQQHWADELAAYTPLEFSLAIDDNGPAADKRRGRSKWHAQAFTPDRAVFPLKMTYRMKVGHAARDAGKTAVWPAVFIKHDPDADGPAPAAWLYAGEHWHTLHGVWMTDIQHAQAVAEAKADGATDEQLSTIGAFTVRFFPGFERVANDVLEAFPPAKRHVDEGFEIDFRPPVPIDIKLFDDMEHLKATVYLNMPDEILGGWNEPGESIKFMTSYTQSIPRWTAAFAHEYGHTATWQLGPKLHDSPWWVQEGVAELAAEHFAQDAQRIETMMRTRAKRTGKQGLLPWDALADYQNADADVKQFAYFQGHHFIGWLSELDPPAAPKATTAANANSPTPALTKRQRRNQWLRVMGEGKTLDQACREVYGVPFADLDHQWRASLQSPSSAHEPTPKHTHPKPAP